MIPIDLKSITMKGGCHSIEIICRRKWRNKERKLTSQGKKWRSPGKKRKWSSTKATIFSRWRKGRSI